MNMLHTQDSWYVTVHVQIVILKLTIYIIYYIKFCVKPYLGQSMWHLYIYIQFGFKCMTHKRVSGTIKYLPSYSYIAVVIFCSVYWKLTIKW